MSKLWLVLVAACGSPKQPAPVEPVGNQASTAPVPDAGAPDAASTGPVNQEQAAAASRAFADAVAGSRAAIQRCYEQALKVNPALQGLTLTIAPSFAADGTETAFHSSPSVTPAFDACLAAVAATWKVSAGTPMTFRVKLVLAS